MEKQVLYGIHDTRLTGSNPLQKSLKIQKYIYIYTLI